MTMLSKVGTCARFLCPLVAEGDGNLYYLSSQDLLGNDHEAATDGSHPRDLGMVRFADAYEPVLREILENR